MPSILRTPGLYKAIRLEPHQSIAIDGQCRDPLWQAANVLNSFSFPWTSRSPPATEFRALWSDQHLYLRFDVTDDDVVLGDGRDTTEKVIGSDRVEIFFSTGPKLKPYYGIEVDPRGEVMDYAASFYRQMDFAWSCDGLGVATLLTNGGYIVEGRIPMTTLRALNCLHHDHGGHYLIAGLYRAEFRHDPAGGPVIEDWITWVDPQVASPDFHVPASFGTIRLVP